MAFQQVVFFAVAHKGTKPQIVATQGPRDVDANALGVTNIVLSGTTSLVDGAGVDLSGGAFHTAFAFTYDGAGTDTGKISFSQTGYNGLAPGDQDSLARAFATGGTLTLQLDVTTGTTNTRDLVVWLGALHTNDFIVNVAGTVATAAHHPGAANPNLVGPVSATATYGFACAALGAGSLGASANTFAVSAAASPLSLVNLPLTVTSTVTAPIAKTFTSELILNLILHTECMVSVDRSGSMAAATPTTDTKWNEAIKASVLFWTLYGEAIPSRTAGATTAADQSLVRFGRWRWLAAFDVEYEPAGFQSAATAADPTAGLVPDGGTPIGQALTSAKALFTSGAWLRRHVLLLTDGMDNMGSPTLVQVDGAPATHLPRLSDSAAEGVIVHTISFAQAGETQVINLHTLATSHNGVFLGSESDADTYSVNLLRERFVNVVGQVLPIQLAKNAAGDTTFDVEDGVDRIVFIAPGAGALSAAGPAADVTDSSGISGAFTWAAALNPTPGSWTVAGAAAGNAIYAVYDVSLRLTNQVEPHGLGRPIKVRALLDFNGQPVTGADVRAGLRRPGESIGEVITSFIYKRGLLRALQSRDRKTLLHPDLGRMLARDERLPASVVAKGVSSGNGDTKSLQRLFLEAAERARNLELQSLGNPIQLLEVAPGVYEGEVPASMTQEEGVYDFGFLAEGVTPGGSFFKRNQRRSVALAPVPSAEHSECLVNQVVVAGNRLWTATVLPRTVTGRALGPGLGYALAFHYADPADRKRLPPPVTVDNLDGTYATHITLGKGEEQAAPLVLVLGPVGEKLTNGMPVQDTRRPRRVRVRLDRLQVLNDHDGCFTGPGELVFDTIVAPNGNPARAVRTRLPESGVVQIKSGQTVQIGHVIYDGLVEAGASLSVTMGGRELDELLFFRRQKKLARYHRSLPLKSARIEPDDEPNNPESLSDWKVWYTVEVE